ncbi:MAG: hypothetical protein RXQ68_00915 [Candidatus Nanopusillus sp.]
MNNSLDKIIEDEFKKFIENLRKFHIIEYIESNYKIKFTEPKLKILESKSLIAGEYSPSKNQIIISKKSIERLTNSQLKFLGYKEIEISIIDIQHIEYLNIPYKSYKSTFVYPLYIKKRNIIETIKEFFIHLAMSHEGWHAIDQIILNKLAEDPTIKDRGYLLTILNNHDNLELRASVFQFIDYYLAKGFHKDERGYIAAYFNIPTCIDYIKELAELEKNKYKSKLVPYDLGLCYGNIIVAKYRSSLEKNIYKVIDDIIHLDKEKAIDVIKNYVYNPDKLLHD